MKIILYVDIYEWNWNFVVCSFIGMITSDEKAIILSYVYETQRTSAPHIHVLLFGDWD